MANITSEMIKAALLAQREKKSGNNTGTKRTGGDNASYPFWNLATGTSAAVRFLPDGDPENMFFWASREVIKLPFAGVVGGDYPTDKEVTVTVPCANMFGMPCPIITHTKPWWNDEAKKDLARKYWKKKSYIFQGFVVKSPMAEESVPENPIRRFVINPSIFTVIEKSLITGDMEDMPTDLVGGREFNIDKAQKGQWANYAASSWSMKSRPLSETELTAIEHHGLHNLTTALGPKPGAAEMEIIEAMFKDSLAGNPFDTAAYGEYYRPWANRDDTGDNSSVDRAVTHATAAPVTAAPAAEAYSAPKAPVAEAAQPSGKPNAQDILARIRARTEN